MRPDIEAGPIGRKCSDSNGLFPVTADAGAGPCWPRPTMDCAPNAAASAPIRMRTRTGFIYELRQVIVTGGDYTNRSK